MYWLCMCDGDLGVCFWEISTSVTSYLRNTNTRYVRYVCMCVYTYEHSMYVCMVLPNNVWKVSPVHTTVIQLRSYVTDSSLSFVETEFFHINIFTLLYYLNNYSFHQNSNYVRYISARLEIFTIRNINFILWLKYVNLCNINYCIANI